MNHFLSTEDSGRLLEYIRNSSLTYTYEAERHRLVLLDRQNNEVLYFRLPLLTSFTDKLQILPGTNNYIILLIQSGSCAMGYFENGQNVDHKVFTSYMVRMKQGKSQIKYLKTKGKSRAGSRVRLGETMEFFENINERLQTYFNEYTIDKIAMSCSKILIPYLYNSKVSTPFGKKDERLIKIPKHVPLPKYEVMLEVNKFLQKGEVIYEDATNEATREIREWMGKELGVRR